MILALATRVSAAPLAFPVPAASDVAWVGERLAVATEDGELVILDPRQGEPVGSLRIRRTWSPTVAGSTGHRALVATDRRGTLAVLLDIDRERLELRIRHQRRWDAAALRADGEEVLVAGPDGLRRIAPDGAMSYVSAEAPRAFGWLGERPWAVVGGDLVVYGAGWMPEAEWFLPVGDDVEQVVALDDGAVVVSGARIRRLRRDGASTDLPLSGVDAYDVTVSPDGRWLGVVARDLGPELVDLTDGARVSLPTSPYTYAAPRFSPDGTRAAVVDQGIVRVFSLADDVTRAVPGAAVQGMGFAADGAAVIVWADGLVATVSPDGQREDVGRIPLGVWGQQVGLVGGGFVAADGAGWVRRYVVEGGALREVTAAGWPISGEEVATAGDVVAVRRGGDVTVFDADGAVRGTVVGLAGRFAVAPDARCVVGGEDRVTVHDLRDGRAVPLIADLPDALSVAADCVVRYAHEGRLQWWSPDGGGRVGGTDGHPTGADLGAAGGAVVNDEGDVAWVDGELAIGPWIPAETASVATAVAASPDGATALVADAYGSVVAWDTARSERRWAVGAPGAARSVAIRGDEVLFVAAGRAWRWTPGEAPQPAPDTVGATAATYGADGAVVAAADAEGEPVDALHVAGDAAMTLVGGQVRVLRGERVVADAWALSAALGAGLAVVWDGDGRLLLSSGGPWIARRVPDPRYDGLDALVAVCGPDRVVGVDYRGVPIRVDVAGGRGRPTRLDRLGIDRVRTGACVGATAYLGLETGDLAVVDLEREELARLLPGDGSPVTAVAADGARVVVGHASGEVAAWRVDGSTVDRVVAPVAAEGAR